MPENRTNCAILALDEGWNFLTLLLTIIIKTATNAPIGTEYLNVCLNLRSR